jgi:cobalamin-dependent methionine synthase I
MGKLAVSYKLSESSPKLVVATPVGQLHEFGALMANVTAVSEGWQTVYLGPNLPAAEIALAVRQNRAAAVALSIVYPSDDPRVVSDLAELRRLISDDTAIIIGGRAASGYSRVIETIGAMTVDDLSELKAGLESIRSRVHW